MASAESLCVESHGSFSHVGTKYGALNQDSLFVELLPKTSEGPKQDSAPDIYSAGIMDGHGMLGEESAKVVGASVRQALHAGMRGNPLKSMGQAKLEEVFRKAFIKAHHASLEVYKQAPRVYVYPRGSSRSMNYRLNTKGNRAFYCNAKGDFPIECGTTCTACVVQGDVAAVAHVGDSTAVLGWVDEDAEDYDGKAITRNHNFEDADERVRCSSIPGVSITDDLYMRVSLKTDGNHEINMSRALGHELLQNYGLIPEPDVTLVELRPETCCLIMATDGVWDYLSPREAVRLVMEVVEDGGSADEAAEALAEDAVQLALDSGDEADNTTAIVFIFDVYQTVSGAAGSNSSLGVEDEIVERCRVSQPSEQKLRDDGHGHGTGDDAQSESSESSRSDVEGVCHCDNEMPDNLGDVADS